MQKVRWGIIGPGKIANRFAEGLNETRFGDLVAIASKSKDRRKTFGDKYNIINSLRFDNYEEILQSPKVDAIYISTPHTLHAEWSIKAANKGKHVLCEKPFALNEVEAGQMCELAAETQLTTMVTHEFRWAPQRAFVKELVDEGYLGEFKFGE